MSKMFENSFGQFGSLNCWKRSRILEIRSFKQEYQRLELENEKYWKFFALLKTPKTLKNLQATYYEKHGVFHSFEDEDSVVSTPRS